jgi:phosphoglucomutase
MTKNEMADLLLATDPDCDRVGIAVLDKGEYKLLSGNEVGALLTEYILSSRRAQGKMPEKPIAVKSFVTTPLITEIAAKYGCEVFDLLTGFKYIGELITKLEKAGEESRFVIGMEESYGYLAGVHARDKDAVVASMLICEMAAYYKSRGKTLLRLWRAFMRNMGCTLPTF